MERADSPVPQVWGTEMILPIICGTQLNWLINYHIAICTLRHFPYAVRARGYLSFDLDSGRLLGLNFSPQPALCVFTKSPSWYLNNQLFSRKCAEVIKVLYCICIVTLPSWPSEIIRYLRENEIPK